MAVALTMVRMKVAIIRHSMTGARAGLVTTGGLLGVALAVGTSALAFVDADLLATAYAVWLLGWVLGPLLAGGGDQTIRPEFFALLGLRPRRLAGGLLAAAFVGVAPAVSLLASAGLVITGMRRSAAAGLVALPALLLHLAVLVLLSKVAVAAFGLALRSRANAVLVGLLNGAVLALLSQGWVFAVAFGQSGGLPPATGAIVRALPSGWGVLAVESAASGHWGRAAALIAALLLFCGLLLVVWAALMARRSGSPRPGMAGHRVLNATSARNAVLGKEIRTYFRDLVRIHQLVFALSFGICFAALPLLVGWVQMLPWAGPVFVLMAAALSANLYGNDGTALWITLLTPRAIDVRGRQLAWLAFTAPVALTLTLLFTALVDGPWALVLAVTFALLGGGAGLAPLVSVYALVPGIDPRRRGGNPLRVTEDDGSATGVMYALLALALLSALPAGVVALLYGWAGVPVGLTTGILCWWGLGRMAARRLRSHGPELLQMMRSGRRDTSATRWTRYNDLSKGRQALVSLCMTACPIALVPQGILPGVFKVVGVDAKAWFLALHVPNWAQWPTILCMVLLGVAFGAAAVRLLREKGAHHPPEAHLERA
ncbi:hypothetical protein [Streptoalloteichus hindustanus]|uniref:ABC-2 type transport system permease protein n=1 Tax=Streptoalloteichus hindustanus TaxID=2017 RepID=A0A1M5CS72_STRHI|nr:hypothetical protein [Streptoalloteichus hindustanus]SHF57570.1 ABC-2 type transport system permease protein [Streptoalloteichus hindustanus]